MVHFKPGRTKHKLRCGQRFSFGVPSARDRRSDTDFLRPLAQNYSALFNRRSSLTGVTLREDHLHGGATRMVAMDGFDHLLNWKLKEGSHHFPGPDGGTCINEAALVAAGFAYKPIRNVEQMPKCFSRPICRFAMQLNDEANDEERQRLLPYVTRLACADTRKVEKARAD